jgi:hypothetical protein
MATLCMASLLASIRPIFLLSVSAARRLTGKPMSDTAPQIDGNTVGTDEPKQAKKIKLGANYWNLWTSSVISNLGDGVTTIALP